MNTRRLGQIAVAGALVAAVGACQDDVGTPGAAKSPSQPTIRAYAHDRAPWLAVQIAGPEECPRRAKWNPCAFYFSTAGTWDVLPTRWRAEARVAPIHGAHGLAVTWCHNGVCRSSRLYVGGLTP